MSSPVTRQYSAVSQAENSERITSVDSDRRLIRSASSEADRPPQYQVWGCDRCDGQTLTEQTEHYVIR